MHGNGGNGVLWTALYYLIAALVALFFLLAKTGQLALPWQAREATRNRGPGPGAFNRLPLLERLFMRHATGTFGDLPRLMCGEAL